MSARPEWLDRDIVSETEQLLGGKHWSEFNNDESKLMLGLAFAHNQKKSEYLSSIGDTLFSMKWEEFKELLIKRGFEIVLTDIFHTEERTEELSIFGYKEKGLLAVATSFMGRLNGGKCYGQGKKNKDEYVNLPDGCSYGWDKDNITDWSMDVRDGMFSRIAAIEEKGITLLSPWKKERSFLWLVDYGQTKGNYNYEEINKERLSRCPDWVREMIGQ